MQFIDFIDALGMCFSLEFFVYKFRRCAASVQLLGTLKLLAALNSSDSS